MAIRISGLQSGLDTESIVSALVSSYAAKKDKYVKAQTKLSWTQDAWKDVNKQVYSLYSSVNSLRYTSAYAMKKTTVSDATKATVTATGSSINGTQTLQITDLAKAGYITGGKLSATDGTAKLSNLGFTGDSGTISLTVGGDKKDIAVTKDTTIDSFVQSLNDAGVKASYDTTNKRLFVSAKDSGTAKDFSLVGSDANGITALDKLGLSVSSTANAEAYTDMAAYALNTEGNAYITYDTTGKVVTNGTYSADKTQTNVESIINQLKSSYAAVSDATTNNTTLNSEINYANAFGAIKQLEDGANGDDIKLYEKIMDISNPINSYVDDSGKVYNSYEISTDGNGNSTYTYKNDAGDTHTSSTALTTVYEKKQALEKSTGLVTTTKNSSGVDVTDSSKLTTFKNNHSAVTSYEANTTNASRVSDVKAAATAGTLTDFVTDLNHQITVNTQTITDNNATIDANATLDVTDDYSKLDATAISSLASTLTSQVTTAAGIKDGSQVIPTSVGATRVNGSDATIILNGATFTSSSNQITVNGLTINATAKTVDGEELTVTTNTDTQGLYDKVKDFLSQYNSVINSINSLYNASSSSGYEPLTDAEKESMTDSQVEKWESNIKSSLLRRDTTLGGILTTMTNSMAQSFSINGSKYSLSSFGISTLGYMNAEKNENYAYHIDGDADDSSTSSNTDKLMKALTNDPDTVIDFMKNLTDGLHDSMDSKMKSTTLRSAYTVYNDKEMASEYSDYTDLISTWEDRLSDMENSYYQKFSKMESALSTLNSNSSSVSSLLK